MPKFSRAVKNQLISRAKKVDFVFDESWKCLICGHNLKYTPCNEHSTQDNLDAIAYLKAEGLVA